MTICLRLIIFKEKKCLRYYFFFYLENCAAILGMMYSYYPFPFEMQPVVLVLRNMLGNPIPFVRSTSAASLKCISRCDKNLDMLISSHIFEDLVVKGS
jgi:hypothetical protein